MENQKACLPARQGSGLIFAVVLMFVILGMVVTLSSITILETKMSQKTKSSVGAFYNSESGVEWALNKIANSTVTTITGTFGVASVYNGVACPEAVGGPSVCTIYLLKGDGTTIANTDADDISLVKAVRSVGSQNTGEVTQRAIEAAVAAGSNICFTYYCGGTNAGNNCLDSGNIQQGYCPIEWTQKRDLGHWGYCDFNSPEYADFSTPPGGGCPSPSTSWTKIDIGSAYLCCQ